MTNWNVASFFSAFAGGTLGRKSQYSTYWVNKFAGCNVLCNKSSGRERVKVIGVYMGPDLCVFNSQEVGSVSEFSPNYIMSFHGVDMEEITESGIIDIETTAGNKAVKSILFQLGTSCYFIEPAWADRECVPYSDYIERHKKPEFNILASYPIVPGIQARYGAGSFAVGANIVKLSGKYNSVSQARLASIPTEVKADPTPSFTFRNWWFTPQPQYVPAMLSKTDQELLERPPMPWHFGLTVDTVAPILSGKSPIEENCEKLKGTFGMELVNKLRAYALKKAQYEGTVAKLRSLYVDQDDTRQFNAGGIAVFPGLGDFGVQKIESDGEDRYLVRGLLMDKRELGHVGFRYGGIERLAKARVVHHMKQWHSMVKGVGYV